MGNQLPGDGPSTPASAPTGPGAASIEMHPEVFQGLITDLEDQHASLQLAAQFREPGAAGFGGSPLGQQLAHHTHLARGHVVTGVNEVTKALSSYAEGLHYFRKGIGSADDHTAAGLTTLQAATQSLTGSLATNRADNSASTLPNAGATATAPHGAAS